MKNSEHLHIQQGLQEYEEQVERKSLHLEERCWVCPRTAVWVYGPGYDNPAEGFRCDKHVPRKPCSCNMKGEFMFLELEVGPNNFNYDPDVHLHKDEEGRHLPCVEWLCLEDKIDL